MDGETDLGELLRLMRPALAPATYVYCTVAAERADALTFRPACLIVEDEGVTVVCTAQQAEQAGLDGHFPCRRITLTVHSSLEAVGLTAAVATALSESGISANVVAGYHHDHVFVPAASAQDALVLLTGLGG